MEVRLKKGSLQGPNEEPNPNMVIPQDSARKIEFRCEICNIAATSQFGLNTHLSGKNHQKKVGKLKNIEKEPVSKKPKLDSETKSESRTKKRKRERERARKRKAETQTLNTPKPQVGSIYTQIEFADFPKKTDFTTKEEFDQAVKNYFKLKGLKHIDEFSDDEKREVCQDNSVNMIGPVKLSQKHKTMVSVIRKIIDQGGLYVIPDDMSKHPDFPKRSAIKSHEEFQMEVKRYWSRQKSLKQKKKDKEMKNKK